MKTYLDKQKVDTLQRAATLADDFSLIHCKVLSRVNTQKGTSKSGCNESGLPPTRYNLVILQDDNQPLHVTIAKRRAVSCLNVGH